MNPQSSIFKFLYTMRCKSCVFGLIFGITVTSMIALCIVLIITPYMRKAEKQAYGRFILILTRWQNGCGFSMTTVFAWVKMVYSISMPKITRSFIFRSSCCCNYLKILKWKMENYKKREIFVLIYTMLCKNTKTRRQDWRYHIGNQKIPHR